MATINLTKKYSENNISQLISKLNFVFEQEQKRIKGFELNVNITVDDFNAITAIVIYKFISFAIENNCFDGPRANKYILDLFAKFHLENLVEAYLENKDEIEKLYSRIKPVIKTDFFIAPHVISRVVVKNADELETKYYETIKNYYENSHDGVVDCIKTCMVEIASNFFYHTTDTKSILMAEGTQNKVEIISVDTSLGIISTMREKYFDKNDTEIIKKAFQRRVSSKLDQGHCGTGLWLVNEIVTKLKGKLILHTEGYIYRNIQGNITTFASSKWKGTILYIKLPISENIDRDIKSIIMGTQQFIK